MTTLFFFLNIIGGSDSYTHKKRVHDWVICFNDFIYYHNNMHYPLCCICINSHYDLFMSITCKRMKPIKRINIAWDSMGFVYKAAYVSFEENWDSLFSL